MEYSVVLVPYGINYFACSHWPGEEIVQMRNGRGVCPRCNKMFFAVVASGTSNITFLEEVYNPNAAYTYTK